MTTTTAHAPFDPATIHLTRHAVDRYMQSRGWNPADDSRRQLAERRIRDLLARTKPTAGVFPGKSPNRRHICGQFVWIIAADNSAVITFFKSDVHRPPSTDKRRRVRRGTAPKGVGRGR